MMMLLTMTVMVYAEPDDAAPKGAVNFKANVPEGVKGSIEFKIYNKTLDIEKGITLSHFNEYEAFIMAEFGEYELTWVRFINEKRIALDYTVTMDPFVIGRENPNGDWSWDIIIDAAPNTENINETVKTELSGAIGNYLSGNNNEAAEKKENNSSNTNTNTLIIPDDNKYFPGMTLDEVKKWYTDEVKKFVSVVNEKGLKNQFGQSYWFTQDPIYEYQRTIKTWATETYDKNENGIQIELNWLESSFHNSSNPLEAREFYEVMMKMFNFIREYQEENNIYLNFTRWDVSSDPAQETTESENTEITTTVEEYTTIKRDSTEEEITTNNSSNGKKGKTIFDILKDSWLTITILIVVAVIGIIFGLKYKK